MNVVVDDFEAIFVVECMRLTHMQLANCVAAPQDAAAVNIVQQHVFESWRLHSRLRQCEC